MRASPTLRCARILALCISRDLPRYQRLVRAIGWVLVLAGPAYPSIDLHSPSSLWWTLMDSLGCLAMALALHWASPSRQRMRFAPLCRPNDAVHHPIEAEQNAGGDRPNRQRAWVQHQRSQRGSLVDPHRVLIPLTTAHTFSRSGSGAAGRNLPPYQVDQGFDRHEVKRWRMSSMAMAVLVPFGLLVNRSSPACATCLTTYGNHNEQEQLLKRSSNSGPIASAIVVAPSDLQRRQV